MLLRGELELLFSQPHKERAVCKRACTFVNYGTTSNTLTSKLYISSSSLVISLGMQSVINRTKLLKAQIVKYK